MSFWTEMMGIPYQVKWVDVAGVSTRVLRAGEGGEPVLFLHGVSGHLEGFLRTVKYLHTDYDLHLIDMYAHGYTDKPDGPQTIDVMADHAIGYLDAAGIDKAHIVGLSLGGWVTGWIGAYHGDRALSLTLVNAAGNPAMGTPEVGAMVRDSTKNGVMSDDRELTRKRLHNVVEDPDLVTEELVDIRFGIYQMPAMRANIDNMLALTEPQEYVKYALNAERCAQVEHEVLLLWGEHDVYSKVLGPQLLVETLPHNKLVTFKDCNHWPPYERPEDFSNTVRSFFSGGLAAVKDGLQ